MRHCKHNYSYSSSILTDGYATIYSMENLHVRIREVMEENKWEPPQVAKICGMKTPHAVYQWLDGTTKNLKLDNLYHFCHEAEIHIEWLITGQLPKYKPEKLRLLEINFEKLGKRDQDLLCTTSNTLAKPDSNSAAQ